MGFFFGKRVTAFLGRLSYRLLGSTEAKVRLLFTKFFLKSIGLDSKLVKIGALLVTTLQIVRVLDTQLIRLLAVYSLEF